MSIRVNWGSVNKKLWAAANSPEARAKREEAVGKILSGNRSVTVGSGKNKMTIHTATEAAEMFVAVLTEIVDGIVASKGMSNGQASAVLSNIVIGAPVDKGDGTCEIHVELARGASESLYPEGYPNGIGDLVLLFDRGIHKGESPTKNPVWGTDEEGNIIYGVRNIPRNQFIKKSIEEFMNRYALKYNIIDAEPTQKENE